MTARRRVLVVDDEKQIRRVLTAYLEADGFAVDEAGSGAEALEIAERTHPTLILLDVGLPDVDGMEVLRRLRVTSEVYVILVTARSDELDKLVGLTIGADDYITKPVPPRVLLARIKALLRRASPGASDETPEASESLSFGSFRISQQTRSAVLAGETIDLTTAEFDLLWLLARHAGSILSRDDLLQQLRGIGFDGLDRSIDARISRLRKKLNDDPDNPTRIKTVRSKGYLFSRHDWQ